MSKHLSQEPHFSQRQTPAPACLKTQTPRAVLRDLRFGIPLQWLRLFLSIPALLCQEQIRNLCKLLCQQNREAEHPQHTREPGTDGGKNLPVPLLNHRDAKNINFGEHPMKDNGVDEPRAAPSPLPAGISFCLPLLATQERAKL